MPHDPSPTGSHSDRLVSVVIPARDEEANLPICVGSVSRSFAHLSERRPEFQLEIVVVVNRCTDRTEQVAVELGCRTVSSEAKNLAVIRNEGVRASSGGIVVTIDADSRMSENMFYSIVDALERRNKVGGGVLILPERWSVGILLTGALLVPIALIYRISAGLFFFRRSDFDAIGGFDERFASVEDIDFAKRLKAHGARTGRRYANILRAHIVTSCRKFDHFGDWYFVLRPLTVLKLLHGKNQQLADQVWYDFPRPPAAPRSETPPADD
jgi:glycosyltransferase involved in cell wall biosynthesis